MSRILRNTLITCIVCLIVGILLMVYLVQPTKKNLNLSYQSMPWGNKIAEALLNRGIVTLTDQDVTDLFKVKLIQTKEQNQVPITGAIMAIESHQIHGWMEMQKGFLPIGISFTAHVQVSGQEILITPTQYWIGRIPMTYDTFNQLLQTIHHGELPPEFRIQLPLPPGVVIKNLQIESGQVNIQFSLKRMF